jgi:hypothetical protein
MENIPFGKYNPTNKWDYFHFLHLPHSFVELQPKAKQHNAQKLSVVLGISAKSAAQKKQFHFFVAFISSPTPRCKHSTIEMH